MTTFWEDFKKVAGHIGSAIGDTAYEASLRQKHEDNLRYEAERKIRYEKALQSGRFIVRDSAQGEAIAALAAFNDLYTQISRHGHLISDNTPGDAMVIPLSANKNYRVVSALNNARLIRTPENPSWRHTKFEAEIANAYNKASGAITIQGQGVKVYGLTDIWCHAIYLRFDRGQPANLIRLKQALETSP